MSSAGNSTGGSRLSNESYPAQSGRDANTADLSHRPDVPTVDERIRGIIESYPDRSFRPLSTIHGRTLREDCLQEPRTTDRPVAGGYHESVIVHCHLAPRAPRGHG